MAVGDKQWTRRYFAASALMSACGLRTLAQTAPVLHADVLGLERARVLEDAAQALAAPVRTLGSAPPPDNLPVVTPNDFVSELEPDLKKAGENPSPMLFTAHATLLREFSHVVAHLTAGFLLTRDARFAARAGEHLRGWLVAPRTRMDPQPRFAGLRPGEARTSPAGVVDLVPLAELARACSFLIGPPDDEGSEALAAPEWAAATQWLKALLGWMNNDRQAAIARDAKDHRASAWLLIVGAASRFVRDESMLEAARKRFRAPTLRNQVRSDGSFPAEIATPVPYRNTLFNYDLLATACQVLSSPFDPLWTYELIDGVGMRSCVSFLYPLIAHPERWPFLADAHGFRQLPGRRAGLLFAGRAYNRPEYIDLWLSTPAGPRPAELAYSYPVTEPGLWTARAPHGL